MHWDVIFETFRITNRSLFFLLVLRVTYRTSRPRLPAAGGQWDVIARERRRSARIVFRFGQSRVLALIGDPSMGGEAAGSGKGWPLCGWRASAGLSRQWSYRGETDGPGGRGAVAPGPVDRDGGSCQPACSLQGLCHVRCGRDARAPGWGETDQPDSGDQFRRARLARVREAVDLLAANRGCATCAAGGTPALPGGGKRISQTVGTSSAVPGWLG